MHVHLKHYFDKLMRKQNDRWLVARMPIFSCSPYVMHRSREYWPDADKFLPERWVELQQQPGYTGFMSFMSNVGEAVNGAYVRTIWRRTQKLHWHRYAS